MIFSFPGQILPNALPGEISRVSTWLERTGITAVASTAVQVDLVKDSGLVELAQKGHPQKLNFVTVPNMAWKELFEVQSDPLSTMETSVVIGMPLTLRASNEESALQRIAGPVRASVGYSPSHSGAGCHPTLENLEYVLLADLISSAWGLTGEEKKRIFLLGAKDTRNSRLTGVPGAQHAARARAAILLQHELTLSSVQAYPAWFRTPWSETSPIKSATPAEALMLGGLSAFTSITSFLEFGRMCGSWVWPTY